ncbi:hypothetical protein SAMN05519103_07140 [Rhizobiales bacterium GAS113]|nr:hypothetical protein SAMN05519103_07140 [Rhizobiales bacterium GAS113]
MAVPALVAGISPAIYAFLEPVGSATHREGKQDVDGRDKPGHDVEALCR